MQRRATAACRLPRKHIRLFFNRPKTRLLCESVKTTTLVTSTKIPPPPVPPNVPFPNDLFHVPIIRTLLMAAFSSYVIYRVYQSLSNKDRDSRSSPGGLLGIEETKIEMTKPGSGVKFADIGGVDEVVEELKDIVDFIVNVKEYSKMGARLPKGVLMSGPPGTGKTMLAKAVANEANVPFFYMSGSEFEEVYVGLGAKRVRKLFKKARENSPCIIFVDEIDALGVSRKHTGAGYRGEQTLNEFLAEFDGFNSSLGIVVIGATNQPEILDAALTRAGRFDKKITVQLPDIKGRKTILTKYLEKLPAITPDSNAAELANRVAPGTAGMSGADLKNLVNEAAIKAALDHSLYVEYEHLDFAKDKVQMGTATTSRVIPEDEKRITAWHESGHALVALFADTPLPLHKLTIIPHSKTLGFMQYKDTDDKHTTYQQLLTYLATAMGGRVAEELIWGYDKITTGATNDLEQATKLATTMVTQYGFNTIGPVDLTHKEYLSQKVQARVDADVKQLLSDAYKTATTILTTQRENLDKLATVLLAKENMSSIEVLDVLGLPPQK